VTTYDARHIEILKAAAALFARQGFHDSSIRDLAKATGRSLSGLYYYVSGKDELLFQIQHHCYHTLLTRIREVLAHEQNPREKLITFIAHHLTFFRHNMDEMKVLAHEDVTLTGNYAEQILALKREYSKVLIDIMEEYAADAPKNLNRPNPEIAAFALFGMMNWLYTWPKRVRDLPAPELAQAIAQLFLCGFPGCPATSMAALKESLACSPQEFWTESTV